MRLKSLGVYDVVISFSRLHSQACSLNCLCND